MVVSKGFESLDNVQMKMEPQSFSVAEVKICYYLEHDHILGTVGYYYDKKKRANGSSIHRLKVKKDNFVASFI